MKLKSLACLALMDRLAPVPLPCPPPAPEAMVGALLVLCGGPVTPQNAELKDKEQLSLKRPEQGF